MYALANIGRTPDVAFSVFGFPEGVNDAPHIHDGADNQLGDPMLNSTSSFRTSMMAAGAVLGAALAGVLVAPQANALPVMENGVLSVTGDAGRNAFVVGSTPAGVITLNGAEVAGGVTISTVTKVKLDGGGGDDILRFDETNHRMPPGEFIGGEGNDQLTGGSANDRLDGGSGIDTLIGNAGVDTIIGGAGNDKSIGGTGDDSVALGEDSDEYKIETGDGSDRIDGDGGIDTLIMNGSTGFVHFSETIAVNPDGARTSARRAQATGAIPPVIIDQPSFAGFEQVKFNMAAGPTDPDFNGFSFSGTGPGVSVIRVDLGALAEPSPGRFKSLGVRGTDAPDRIRILGTPSTGVTVGGLSATLLATGVGALQVQGLGGDDVIDAARLTAGTVKTVSLSGDGLDQTGNDTLIGSTGHDLINGNGGNDHIEGRAGNDDIFGDDSVPGDDDIDGGEGDDTITGGGGNDRIRVSPGNDVIL